MKTIFVTGGAGFIGSNFIRYIIHKYHRYRIVNLDKLTHAGNLSNLKDINDKRYQFIKGDICNQKLVKEIFITHKIDWVINGAAETHVDRSIQNPRPFIETNILGTENLLRIAKNYPISRFVQISTDEVYGSLESGSWTEMSPFNPSSPYAATKAAADLLTLSYWKTYQLPTIIIRPTNNFGPYQFPEKFIPRLITNALLGKNLPVYGRGQNIRDWIYVEDTCRAIDLVLHKGKIGEIYNLGGGNLKTNLAVAQTIQKRFPKVKIQPVSDRPGHDFRYSLSWTKIKKMGFKPKFSFKRALQETINWYNENQSWWKDQKAKIEGFYEQKIRENF